MHLPDGIVPLPLALAGYVASGLIAWACLRRIERKPDPRRELPRAAMLTAAFFIASLIYLPLPPVSVHLVLNGLLGAVLGWFAFPAILVGLLLQAVMFGHGGITTLGLNGLIFGLPALASYAVFVLGRKLSRSPRSDALFGFVAGAFAVAASALLFVLLLLWQMPAELDSALEQQALRVFVIAHVPVMLLEGLVTATLVALFVRIDPALLVRV
ncbi:cobalt transporter CbiM [Azoarcus taiwanensis]|uniref:Cobalt transporter CbiM n=1 Tax=Azoarcus taiwanensis TaxID=666964 RepID=A0A972FFJ2_9RHOO|nr:cobalt transporter CbiM [Azoarcus taiwanensis]NMG01411.1 cobalt transporter CbiM [Azoarcus taiwanensis]